MRYTEIVMTLFSPNIDFKSKTEYHRKIEATSASNLEPYSRVRSVVESLNFSNLSADFR